MMENKRRLFYLEDLLKFPIRIDHYDKEHGDEHFVFGVECVLEYAECLPAVDAVEVVHARWKNGDCTACGFDIRDMIDGESEFHNWVWEGLPYCPNCGAKMDLEE